MMRHLVTWCPYDQYPLGVTLDDDNQPTEFEGDCMHAALANLYLESGDDLRTLMPALAAHLTAVIERATSPRGRHCTDAGPPFHYPAQDMS